MPHRRHPPPCITPTPHTTHPPAPINPQPTTPTEPSLPRHATVADSPPTFRDIAGAQPTDPVHRIIQDVWFEVQWASSPYIHTPRRHLPLVRSRCAQHGHAIPTDDDIRTRWTTLDTVQGVYEIRAIPHTVIEAAVEATGADDGELEYLRSTTPQSVMRAASDRHEHASIAYLSPIVAAINEKRMETNRCRYAAHIAEFGPTAQTPSGDSCGSKTRVTTTVIGPPSD